MKVLSTTGLTELIELIKSGFISVDDTETTTEIDTVTTSEVTLATVATSGSYNDLLNKPDLSAKADVDLSNVNSSGTSTASGWAMPSSTYDELTLGASGATYTAPANGYMNFIHEGLNGQWIMAANDSFLEVDNDINGDGFARIFIPCKKGDIITITYTANGNYSRLWFYYADGEV
jgi:hypothetical protein